MYFFFPDCDFWRALICALREERRRESVAQSVSQHSLIQNRAGAYRCHYRTRLRCSGHLLYSRQWGVIEGWSWQCPQNSEITERKKAPHCFSLPMIYSPYEQPSPTCSRNADTDLGSTTGVEGQLLIECAEEMESREAVYHSLSHEWEFTWGREC